MDIRRTQGRWAHERPRRVFCALIVAVGALLAPAGAAAATLNTNTGQGLYTYLPAAGEANMLVIDGDATNYTFTDSVAISDSNSGGACTQLSPNSIRCPRVIGANAMNRVRADLAFPPVFSPDNAPNTFRYNGVPPPGTATEPGLRVESALTNSNDDIVGSSGNDLIRSYGGVDTVSGGDGNDVITATPPEFPPSSTFSGGNGNDEINASGATAATITGGEGDDVLKDAGTVLGEGGADTITNHGDFGGLVGDLLDGGAGDDALVELPDTTDCPFTVADTNIGGPGRDTVYDDCGTEDVFKLKDGEADKWHCGDFTGIAELDPERCPRRAEARLRARARPANQVPEDQEGHREVQAGQRQQSRGHRVQARQEEVQEVPGAREVQEPQGRQAQSSRRARSRAAWSARCASTAGR